jgi:hypothetical protein
MYLIPQSIIEAAQNWRTKLKVLKYKTEKDKYTMTIKWKLLKRLYVEIIQKLVINAYTKKNSTSVELRK